MACFAAGAVCICIRTSPATWSFCLPSVLFSSELRAAITAACACAALLSVALLSNEYSCGRSFGATISGSALYAALLIAGSLFFSALYTVEISALALRAASTWSNATWAVAGN